MVGELVKKSEHERKPPLIEPPMVFANTLQQEHLQ